MDGILIQVDSGTFGAVTNVARAAGTTTTAFNANGSAPANYWTALLGFLVHDTTNDTWFYVDKDLGARQAQFTRPMIGVPNLAGFVSFVGFNQPGTITAGHSYVVYRFPKVHLGLVRQFNFDMNQAAAFPVWQHLWLIGIAGESGPAFDNKSSISQLFVSECLFDQLVTLRALVDTGTAYNCYFKNGAIVDGFNVIAGAIGSFSEFMNQGFADGDCVLHGTVQCVGPTVFGAVFADGTLDVATVALDYQGAGMLSLMNGFSFYGAGVIWGSGSLAVASGGRVIYDGTAAAQVLLLGTLKVAGLTTGAKVTPGSPRVVTDGVAITAANIDDTTAGKLAGIESSKLGGAGIFPYAA